MSLEYARLAWRRYLADGTDDKAIPILEEQNALTEPASTIASAAMADVVVLTAGLRLSPAISSDEEDRMMEDLVEAEEGERFGVKYRLCNFTRLKPS